MTRNKVGFPVVHLLERRTRRETRIKGERQREGKRELELHLWPLL